jgi:hypothetical protein
MLTVALGETPNRDQGSQKKKRATQKKEQTWTAKLQELRRRKSERALPNSKSFGEEQTLTLTILTLAEPTTTLYSKPFHEELCLGLWVLQQERFFSLLDHGISDKDGLRIRLKRFIRAAPACSQYVTLPNYLAHPSLVIYFFPTPCIKLKLGGRLCNPLTLHPPQISLGPE